MIEGGMIVSKEAEIVNHNIVVQEMLRIVETGRVIVLIWVVVEIHMIFKLSLILEISSSNSVLRIMGSLRWEVIIHHHRPLGRLREGVAPIDADLLTSDPDVRFFNAHNPSHADGDELVCLAAFDAHMAWHFIRRQLRRERRSSSPPCT